MRAFLPSYQIERCIPKADLVDGATYKGRCRNTDKAKWDANIQKFVYPRRKFEFVFMDEIHHPEDDVGFDCFVPWERID